MTQEMMQGISVILIGIGGMFLILSMHAQITNLRKRVEKLESK
jgi:hypothetical protein